MQQVLFARWLKKFCCFAPSWSTYACFTVPQSTAKNICCTKSALSPLPFSPPTSPPPARLPLPLPRRGRARRPAFLSLIDQEGYDFAAGSTRSSENEAAPVIVLATASLNKCLELLGRKSSVSVHCARLLLHHLVRLGHVRRVFLTSPGSRRRRQRRKARR